jgi:hypothetical protein
VELTNSCLSGCFSIIPDVGVSLHGHATSTCGLLKLPEKLELTRHKSKMQSRSNGIEDSCA